MDYLLENGCLSVKVSCRGAQLVSIKKDGVERLWQGSETTWAMQAPVLFPICGSLRDDAYIFEGKRYQMPKHGFAQFADFTLEQHSPHELSLLLLSDAKTRAIYPFNFAFRVQYRLENSTLAVTYKVENTGEKPMYFSVGGHEGQAVSGGALGCFLVFEQTENLDSALLLGPLLNGEQKNFGKNTNRLCLTEELFALDTLIFQNLHSKSVALENAIGKQLVTLDFEEADALLVWSMPSGEFLCLEPWNGLPDFVNSDGDLTKKPGMIKLLPGENCQKTHRLHY